MSDRNLASPCGLYCGSCEHRGTQCQGYRNQTGKPFWTDAMKVETCPLYDYCVNKRTLKHCGYCDEFACEIFNNFYDPNLSPEEARASVLSRRQALMRRKEIGTEKWVEEMRNN